MESIFGEFPAEMVLIDPQQFLPHSSDLARRSPGHTQWVIGISTELLLCWLSDDDQLKSTTVNHQSKFGKELATHAGLIHCAQDQFNAYEWISFVCDF